MEKDNRIYILEEANPSYVAPGDRVPFKKTLHDAESRYEESIIKEFHITPLFKDKSQGFHNSPTVPSDPLSGNSGAGVLPIPEIQDDVIHARDLVSA